MAKKCPLLVLGMYANSEGDLKWKGDADDCKESECEWWLDIPSYQACAVRGIVELLMRRLPGG